MGAGQRRVGRQGVPSRRGVVGGSSIRRTQPNWRSWRSRPSTGGPTRPIRGGRTPPPLPQRAAISSATWMAQSSSRSRRLPTRMRPLTPRRRCAGCSPRRIGQPDDSKRRGTGLLPEPRSPQRRVRQGCRWSCWSTSGSWRPSSATIRPGRLLSNGHSQRRRPQGHESTSRGRLPDWERSNCGAILRRHCRRSSGRSTQREPSGTRQACHSRFGRKRSPSSDWIASTMQRRRCSNCSTNFWNEGG